MPTGKMLATQDAIARLLCDLNDTELWRITNALMGAFETNGDLARTRRNLSRLPDLFPIVRRERLGTVALHATSIVGFEGEGEKGV